MEALSLSGVALLLMLGLRHGLDPDHVALIDALTVRAQQQNPRMAPWVGTWFALGHGAVVSLIAMAVSLGAGQLQIPEPLIEIADWVPVVLLSVVGTANLLALRRAGDDPPPVWRERLIPLPLRRSTHPLALFIMGALFAAIFDTVTQASAWGYIATQHGGLGFAALVGGVFTLGMLITDTLDAHLLCRLLRDPRPAVAQQRRRTLGIVVVLMSYGVVLYTLLSKLIPQLTLSAMAYTGIGTLMLAALAALLLRRAVQIRQQPPPAQPDPAMGPAANPAAQRR